MPTNNGYITAPVTVRDIARTIGAASIHLANLGIHPYVNKWSSRKPAARTERKRLTDLQAKQDDGNNPYGLELPFISNSTDADGNPLYHPERYMGDNGMFAEWVYNKPDLVTQPVRKADFNGYEHYIADLFKVLYIRHDRTAHQLLVRIDINQISCRHDDTLNSAGGNAGDGVSWGHLTPRNFYLPESTTVRLSQFYIGVALWDTYNECWTFIRTMVSPIGDATTATVALPTALFDDTYLIAPCVSRQSHPDGTLDGELQLTDCIAIEMLRPVTLYLSNYAVGTMLLKTTGNVGRNYYTYQQGAVTRETAVTYAPNDYATTELFENMPLRTMVLSGGLVSHKPSGYTTGTTYRLPVTTLHLRNVSGELYIYLAVTYNGGWHFALHTYEVSAEGIWEETLDGPAHTHRAINRIVVSNNVSGMRPMSCDVTVWYTDGDYTEQSFTFPALQAFIAYEREGTETQIYVGAQNQEVATNLPDSYAPAYALIVTSSLDENHY